MPCILRKGGSLHIVQLKVSSTLKMERKRRHESLFKDHSPCALLLNPKQYRKMATIRRADKFRWQECRPNLFGQFGWRFRSKSDVVKAWWRLVQLKFDLPLDLSNRIRWDTWCHFRDLSLFLRLWSNIRSAGLQSIVVCLDTDRGKKRSCNREPTADGWILEE